MKQAVEEAAKKYADRIYQPVDRGILHKETQKDFIAGAEWQTKQIIEANKVKPKTMCLRDKSKVCNLCHDCDVYVLNPNY